MGVAGQQYMSISDERKEIEVIPVGNPIRRIHICDAAVPGQGEIDPSALKFVFGPLYREHDLSASGKDEAWRKILEENKNFEVGEIEERYMCAIRRIDKKARAAYGNIEELNKLTKSEFRWMMIKDGCFFLQLALYILGASKQLGYPKRHLIFGEKQSKKTLQEWLKSMFLMGNQIPLVVLNELMKQDFFQNVVKGKQWERPTDMLSKQILYDLLVACISTTTTWPDPAEEEQPSDLLHGLQLLLLGKGEGLRTENERQEEPELEDEDLEAGFKIYNNNNNNMPMDKKDLKNKDDDENKKELCASQLQKKGIFIWRSKKGGWGGGGSRGIRFRNWFICATLTLPSLKVNHDLNVLLTNLKFYEIAQQQKEVRSYLKFLSELISTYEDVNLLAKKGIIEAGTSEEKQKFMEMVTILADKEIAHHHRHVIGRVKDYSVFPWDKFKYVAILVFALTIAQTVFSVLSYVVGLRQLHQSRA